MIATLRQRDFSLLWFAGLVSMIGNWMLGVALSVLVYSMTGSVLAVGANLLATTLPSLLFGSLAGVFVDRWERRQTLVITNLLLALTLLPLLLVRSTGELWLVYIVSFAQSTLSQFLYPAENALLPLLSDPKYLTSANALNALNNNLARLIGPAAGGLVVAQFGAHGAILFDGVSFLFAATLIALIRTTSHPGKTTTNKPNTSLNKIANEWLEGVRLIWRDKTLRVLFLATPLISVGESVMSVLYVPFVTDVLRGTSIDVGGLMSAQAVGGIVGGVLITSVAARFKTFRLLGISAMIFGFLDLALFNYTTFILDGSILIGYVLILLVGPFSVAIGASYNTLIQSTTTDAYRGRVFATIGLTGSLSALFGIGIAVLFSEFVGIVPVINIQGYVYILMGVIVLIALRSQRAQRVEAPLNTTAALHNE
jgi:MFS family permease